jgi:glycosyl transferase family WbsX
MKRLGVLAVLVVLQLPLTTAASEASGGPRARVGVIYFDGWAGTLHNAHFEGMVNGPFRGRRPLSGWRDVRVETMRTQLSWARQDGIDFFLFDWYYGSVDPSLNTALANYRSLPEHGGVGFSLLYVNSDPFVVPLEQWDSTVERWVSEDFANPDYARIDGKPILVILDAPLFTQQFGGVDGVNSALQELRNAARAHGLPGVFVVGGLWVDFLFDWSCFPDCQGITGESYDAISQYNYPAAISPVDGERPYEDVVAAEKVNWERFAEMSPFPYIPSVMAGWDARPWNEKIFDRLFWYRRSPAQVAAFLGDAINWVAAHPEERVQPAPQPPLVLLEAWNEFGEGSHVLPTVEDGYRYGEALAGAVGLPWSTVHARRVTATVANGALTGIVQVLDDWTPCDVTGVRIDRRVHGSWTRMRTVRTRPGGAFSVRLPHRRAVYRAVLSQTLRYRQTCGAASSAAIRG